MEMCYRYDISTAARSSSVRHLISRELWPVQHVYNDSQCTARCLSFNAHVLQCLCARERVQPVPKVYLEPLGRELNPKNSNASKSHQHKVCHKGKKGAGVRQLFTKGRGPQTGFVLVSRKGQSMYNRVPD